MTSVFKAISRGLLGVAALLAISFAAAPAAAQDNGLSESVVAVVNDDIISTYDLVQRMRLLVVTSGIQVNDSNLPQIRDEALRSLVDERLQIQELRRVEREQRFEIIATDQDVDEEIAQIAQGNNTTAEGLLGSLAAQGVGADTFRAQLRAEISWQRWIRGRYGSRVRIGEDQIKAVLAQMAADSTRTQYQIAEVFIDAQRVGGSDQAVAAANQLIAQLQQGAPFQAVARQFSSAPTAASGGDAGWVGAGQMPPEVEAALQNLRPGQLSQPIVVRDGVYIILLRDLRAGGASVMVKMSQVAVPLAADAPEAEVEAARVKLEAFRPSFTGCATLQAAAEAQGLVSSDLGEADVSQLSPAFKAVAETVPVGQMSEPIRTAVGLHLVTVCESRSSGANAPTREQIENRLVGQQLTMISRRYLRDLRNAATIDQR